MKKLTDDVSISELMEMRNQGMTNPDIANALDTTSRTVWTYIGPDGTRGKHRKMDFSSRVKAVEAKYASEPAQEPAATSDEPKACMGLCSQDTTFQTLSDHRKYTIHRDCDACEVTMHTDCGDILLSVEDIKSIANECSAIIRWLGDSLTLKMEVV